MGISEAGDNRAAQTKVSKTQKKKEKKKKASKSKYLQTDWKVKEIESSKMCLRQQLYYGRAALYAMKIVIFW